VGAHLTVVLLVSLPQILLYTMGLPLAATIFLYRRRERLGDKQVQFRWGLLYAGFRHKVWWWELSVVVRKVSMILVGGVFGFHLKPDMQVHLALFLIALMIVAHLVARPFDELTKAHRVLQWLELGSLCVCWLTLHAGTVFFVGEKEGRISHESLTALSFYVVGGNMCFSLYLAAVYARAAFRESRTGGVVEQRRKSQLVAAQRVRRMTLNAALGKKAVLRKVKSQKARALVSAATTAIVAHREVLVDRRSAATKRLKRRLESRMKRRRVGVETAVETGVKVEVAAGAEATARLGANAQWQAIVDPTTGSTYYYNTETGESSWARPVH
jgi:hypothetical protein